MKWSPLVLMLGVMAVMLGYISVLVHMTLTSPTTRLAPSGAHAQATPAPRDPLWELVIPGLIDPCRGVNDALRFRGINPYSANPLMRSLRANSWAVMIPVLYRIAIDDAVAGDPRAIMDAIGDLAATGSVYPPQDAIEALNTVEAITVPAYVAATWHREPVPLGRVIVGMIFSDSTLRAAYYHAASVSGLANTTLGRVILGTPSREIRELLTCVRG